MEFRVEVTQAANGGWTVETSTGNRLPVTNAAGASLVREVAALKTVNFLTPLVYPVPPAGEVARLPQDAPHRPLCTDADLIAEAHQEIVDRSQPNLVMFGRYLFDTLLGHALWERLNELAGAQPIELSLLWASGDAPMQRLPWEMMHNGTRFLGQEGQLAILRRVTGATQTLKQLSSPPRVLFVVGTELHNYVIRPGAEYLRLLQGLRIAGLNLSLKTRLLLRTTRERLEAALDEFKPDIAHFICHGFYDDARKCYLQLVDKDDPQQPWRLYGTPLADLLREKERMPSVVVLSASYTGSPDLAAVGQVAAPLAAELVSGGVPIAVGMAGRITDQAC